MQYICLWLIGCFCVLTNSQILPECTQPVICIESCETEDCFISFIVDDKGSKFVVKQIKDISPDEQFLLVLDAVGCHIAKQVDIPINRVVIISAEITHLGKIRTAFPATLHTLAPGVSTEQKSLYQNIDIHQIDSAMWQKWGALSPEETGLTIDIIQNMTKHSDLPKIVALDTFVGNADRSASNLFYDARTDHFCGIDMAASFNTDLAKEACRQIQALHATHTLLSETEKSALIEYARILEILIKNYPPEKQENLLMEYAQIAGFKEGSHLLDENVRERILFHKERIKCNYEYSQNLIPLILQLSCSN